MKAEETAHFYVARDALPAALADAAAKALPDGDADGGAKVGVKVTLTSFENPKGHWDLEADAKKSTALNLKDSGNKWFKSGKLERAQRRYASAAEIAENAEGLGTEVLVPVCNNRAAVATKQEDWASARAFCDTALRHDAANAKALWRRGCARCSTPTRRTARAGARTRTCRPRRRRAKRRRRRRTGGCSTSSRASRRTTG